MDAHTVMPFVEPNTQSWIDELAAGAGDGPPLYELSPKDARQVLRDIQASVHVEMPAAEVEDRVIAGGPTGEVNIRIVKPVDADVALPVIFHCHGGGWILGDRDTHERLDRELATLARAVVVFVDYTPAPEAQDPVQNEQAYKALEWTVATAGELGGDPGRVALFGESVGGNMAAALTLMAK
jgi:acetyl esterase